MSRNVGGHDVEVIEAFSAEELKQKIKEFMDPKERVNDDNARAGGTVPLLYDLKVLDTKIIPLPDGGVKYIAVIRY